MNNLDNLLEKRRKRKELIIAIITAPIIFSIEYYFLSAWISFSTIFTPMLISACFASAVIIFITLFCYKEYLGIKLPKKKLPDWMFEELENLEKIYRRIISEKYRMVGRWVDNDNGKCPACGNTKGIVNKIRNTQGDVSGDFSLGFGSVKGETATEPVNYCPKCQNEWKKRDFSTYGSPMESALDTMFDKMYIFFDRGEDNFSDPLKKFHAKSILYLLKHNSWAKDNYKAKAIRKLSVKDLQKYGCE